MLKYLNGAPDEFSSLLHKGYLIFFVIYSNIKYKLLIHMIVQRKYCKIRSRKIKAL